MVVKLLVLTDIYLYRYGCTTTGKLTERRFSLAGPRHLLCREWGEGICRSIGGLGPRHDPGDRDHRTTRCGQEHAGRRPHRALCRATKTGSRPLRRPLLLYIPWRLAGRSHPDERLV